MKGIKILSLVLAVMLVLGALPVGLSFTAAAEDTVAFTVVPDKTTARPGDTITYTIYIGPFAHISGLQYTLGLPDGLTMTETDTQSGFFKKVFLDCSDAQLRVSEVRSTYLLFSTLPMDFSTTETLDLMSFTCTVNADAVGEKTIALSGISIPTTAGTSASFGYEPAGSAVTVQASQVPAKVVQLENRIISFSEGLFFDAATGGFSLQDGRVLSALDGFLYDGDENFDDEMEYLDIVDAYNDLTQAEQAALSPHAFNILYMLTSYYLSAMNNGAYCDIVDSEEDMLPYVSQLLNYIPGSDTPLPLTVKSKASPLFGDASVTYPDTRRIEDENGEVYITVEYRLKHTFNIKKFIFDLSYDSDVLEKESLVMPFTGNANLKITQENDGKISVKPVNSVNSFPAQTSDDQEVVFLRVRFRLKDRTETETTVKLSVQVLTLNYYPPSESDLMSNPSLRNDGTYSSKILPEPPGDPYPLWVGGVQFDSKNLTIDKDDIPGVGGSATYDPQNRILTLDSFQYAGAGYQYLQAPGTQNEQTSAAGIYYAGAEGETLTVRLVNENTVTVTGAAQNSFGFRTDVEYADVVFTGTGSLHLTGDQSVFMSAGAYIKGNVTVESGAAVECVGGACDSASSGMSNVGTSTGIQAYKLDVYGTVTGTGGTANGGSVGVFCMSYSYSKVTVYDGGALSAAGGSGSSGYGLQTKALDIQGGTVTAKSGTATLETDTRALCFAYTVQDGIEAKGSVNSDGADAKDYDAALNSSYLWFHAEKPVTFSVTVTAGEGMAKTSGDDSQTVKKGGSMNSVVYQANNGYYFPEDYAVDSVNGISVTRVSYTQITVSGTPTADAAITLPAATAKAEPDMSVTAPTVTYGQNAVITATLPDDSDGSVIFSLVGENNTYTFADDSITDGVAQVSQKLNADTYTVTATYSGDGKYDGVEKTIQFTVEKAATELAIATSPDTLVYGDAVQITVTLSGGAVFAGDQIDPDTGEPAKAPGSVTITVDGKEYRTISTDPDDVMIVINGNTATLEVTGLNAGQHTIDAEFVASDNYAGSSQTATFDIGKATPQITLTAKSLNDAATAYEITVTKPTDSTQYVEIYAAHSGLDVITFTVRNDKFENGSYTFRFPDVIQDLLPNNISGEFRLSAVYDGSSDQNYQDKTVELTITLGCDHVWKEPEWDWSQDVNNPTYTAECSLCETGKITGTVASTPGTRVEATVEKNAYTPYSASVELSGHTYTGTFDLDEPGTMLAARKAAFDAYKAAQKQAADQLAQPNDSAECAALIAATKTAIDNVTYDESKSLDQNKQAVDAAANLPQLEEKLTDQRAADAVEKKINDIGDVAYTDESKDKIDEARKAYDDLTDTQKALVDNKDTLEKAEDAYQLLDDKNTFEEYKDELKQAAEDMRKDDDSQESKKLIDDTIAAIEALEYDETKSLDDNKKAVEGTAKLDELTEQLEDHRAIYYAVFKADGKEIASLPYTIDTVSLSEPAVPVKDNYTGAWPQYELKEGGVEINAVYVKNDALVITDNAKEQGADRVLTFMETVTFTTDTSSLPEGATLCWYVNGEAVTAEKSVTVENPKDDYTVQVRAFAKDGTVYTESEILTVKVDHSAAAKIIAVAKLSFSPIVNAMKKVVPSFFSFLIALIKAVAAAVVAVVKSVI